MAYRYYLFCRSSEPVSRADLIDFLRDDVDFMDEHSPAFEPARQDAHGGGVLTVHYDGDCSLTFKVKDDRPSIEGSVEDAVAALELSGPLCERLRQTRTMVVIEPGTDLPDDLWGILACVESFLMRERDGVLYNGKGVYDADRRTLAGDPA